MSRKRVPSRRKRIDAVQPANWWQSYWFLGAVLVIAVVIAYQQVWHAGYIWDDDSYVTKNATLRDLHGLWRIWFELAATPQYYPLVHSSFWIEHHLWGLNPLGYHLVNLVLHALAAILLWRVLIRLGIPGAWLAAAIFALHPVEVESVAWITERKNVLSAVFYFAAALAYLRFEEARDSENRESRRWQFYLASLFLFILALLSKTVACSLPAALLLVRWWKTGRLKWRDISPLVPFFIFGLALGLLTAWLEKHQVRAEGEEWALSFGQRCLIAGRALWFYATKLFFPAKLTFIYPRWEVSTALGWAWLFPSAFAAVVAALWQMRARIGRGPLVAVLFFAGTLFPALGFLNVYPFRYSFVADHFQYLASVGLIVLAAAGLTRLPRFVPPILLAVLAVLTWKQVGIYRDLETLWSDTIAKDPGSWMAENNLGLVLQQKGQHDEAIAHLQKSLELNPNKFEIQNNLGYSLSMSSRLQDAFPFLEKAVQMNPNYAAVHYNLGNALLRSGRLAEAIAQLQQAVELDPTHVPSLSNLGSAFLQTGQVDESLAHLQKALEIDPNYKPAHFNLANTLLQMRRIEEAVSHLQRVLEIDPADAEAQKNMAWVLATCPNPRFRDGAKAVELAERASKAGSANPVVGATLAAAYAEAGRFSDAVATAEGALQLATSSGNLALAEVIRIHLEFYRAERPFRDVR
ncbi:MAG: tetratricopeptide repeat protein [Chthoniobacterales bacterium]